MQPNKLMLSRRKLLAGAGTLLAAPSVIRASDAWAQQFSGKTIRILTFSNVAGQLVVDHIAKPFEAATGARVIADLSPSTADMVSKVKASAANQQYDVVVLAGVGGRELVDGGLAEAPDPSKIPNLQKVVPDLREALDGQGLHFLLNPEGLVYNSQTFQTAPDSFEVLWDEAHADRVVLPPASWIQAMFLTVLANRLAGGADDDADKGFAKLAELQDRYLMLGENPPQVAEAIRGNAADVGGVLPALYFANFLFNPDYHLKATVRLKEGFFFQPQYLVALKGHPGDSDVIHAFLNQALDTEAQTRASEGQFAGAINMEVEVPQDKLALDFVLTPEAIREQGIRVDEKFLASVRADWTARYSEIFS